MNVKNLFKKDVIDADGNKVGKISDMDIEMEKGVINYLILSTGFMKKSEIKINKIKSIGDTILLNIHKDELTEKK
jgi:sporulation protein YlmC with PRC-barrel domain